MGGYEELVILDSTDAEYILIIEAEAASLSEDFKNTTGQARHSQVNQGKENHLCGHQDGRI